jgi:undecaprenyl-diphosphatase
MPHSAAAPSPLAAWAALSLPVLGVAAGCLLLFGSEAATAEYFSAWRAANPDGARLFKLYTNWGNPALYLVYAGLLLRGLSQKRRGPAAFALAYLAGQLLFSLAVERLLKVAIGRPRPGVGGPFLPWSLDAGHHAMPSGHVAEFTVQTLPLALRARTLLPTLGLGLAAGLMAASRVVLGWHHPTDLVAGWAVGSLGGLFIHRLAPKIAARLPRAWSA